MMIILRDDKFQIRWNYAIKNNKKTWQDKEYYSHSTIFPAELHQYYQQDTLWIYREQGHNYITNQEPPHERAQKIKLFNKGNQNSKDITLSKKFFEELKGKVEGKVHYTLHLDETDILGERGKLEIKLNIKR